MCFSFCFIITVSFDNTPFATIVTAIIRNSRPVLFCEKCILANFAKFTPKHQKRDPGADVFL